MPEELLSVEELSALLKIPVRTIYDWRQRGVGPRAIKIGKYLRYRVCDVKRWLDGLEERPRPEPAEENLLARRRAPRESRPRTDWTDWRRRR